MRRLNTSGRDRDGCRTFLTRHDADGVRIVIQDPPEAVACLIPVSCSSAPPEELLGRSQVPIAFFGFP